MHYPVIHVPWCNRRSACFDGIGAFARNADADLQAAVADAGTLALWFRLHAEPTGIDYLAAHAVSWLLRLSGASGAYTLSALLYYDGGGAVWTQATGLDLGLAWHHAVMSWARGGALRLTLDGVLRATVALADTPVNGSLGNPSCLGADGFGGHAAVYLDEVGIWGAALDDGGVAVGEPVGGAVAELYHGGTPGLLYAHSAAADLVAWWRLGDGDTFPVLTDWAGHGHAATLQSMTASDLGEDTP